MCKQTQNNILLIYKHQKFISNTNKFCARQFRVWKMPLVFHLNLLIVFTGSIQHLQISFGLNESRQISKGPERSFALY
jgi:hypothetical protein